MNHDFDNDPPLGMSARQWRESIKHTQATDTHLRLFQRLGTDLYEQGWTPSSANSVLQALSAFVSAQHALLAVELSGVLQVSAQKGQTLPVGSRIPMMGTLATSLKSPVIFDIIRQQKSSFWTYEEASMESCFLPLAHHASSVGILAFSGKNLMLGSDERVTLKSVCGLLATIVAKQSFSTSSTVDRTILDRLTPREREILAMLPAGPSNAELGEMLGIAAGTAKIHVERVISKLGVKDRTQAAVKAVELGYRAE